MQEKPSGWKRIGECRVVSDLNERYLNMGCAIVADNFYT